MKRFFPALILILGITILPLSLVYADISLPKKQTFYDKLGRGVANVILAPAEIYDSFYTTLQEEGPTLAVTKGLVQGTGRMWSDISLGFYDVVTSPFPTGPDFSYRTWKQPAHGSMTVNEYPPADFLNNWY
jgi:putative exosortase-associated protein (TIGR04073 family)